MTAIRRPSRIKRLASDRRGLALIEFALTLPLITALGLYGVETANLAIMNLRVSQVALNLADNASRVGVDSGLSTTQLREIDVNDIFDGVRAQSGSWLLSTNGRITLSSLENKSGVQSIHWQRCMGLKKGAGYDSSYGTTTVTDGTDTKPANDGTLSPGGMGDVDAKVTAPPESGVMFVEINYDYIPVVGSFWLKAGSVKLHYIASFIVRDRRDFSQIFNPAPADSTIRSTCDKFAK